MIRTSRMRFYTALGELRAAIDAAHQWLGVEGTPEP